MDKYNCINIAIKYLIEKCGSIRCGLIKSSERKLSYARGVRERRKIENSFTDEDYCLSYNQHNVTDEDMEIHLLINEYYLSIKVREELYNKLAQKNIISL
jgi:hypothetical protein